MDPTRAIPICFFQAFSGLLRVIFDRGRLTSLELEEELRVVVPGELIRLRLELLVVEMATTCATLLPLGGEHDVAAVG
jgi:hypothetical protein